MSGYPYSGNPPQYPPPQNTFYPNLYNQPNAPPPGQPNAPYPAQAPGQLNASYPAPQPGQNPPYGFQQAGYAYLNQPYSGQAPATQPIPGHPAAMSYPGVPPSAPAPSFGYTGYPNVPQQPSFGSPVEWVLTTPQLAHTLSDRAVVAGYEGYDRSPLWVIRARFEGDLIPGKLAVKHHAAYVPWGGNENAVQQIEVCCARPDKIRWVESRGGVIPQNAVVGGNTASGETLFVGRAKEQGSLTPGKVHPSHRVMYISFAGKEMPHEVYEILCTV